MAGLTGQQLGQYELIDLIGEGGMAAVYRARRLNLKGEVAIKVIRAGLAQRENAPEFIRRFHIEAEIIAGLSHPYILKLFDYGQHEDIVYLVMELLPGGSLAQLIGKAPLPQAVVARILNQIGSALSYAHEHGVVHRDLKPQNILLDEQGNAILSDFGVAKLLVETSQLTDTGGMIGTPAYMAPEQWRGEAVTKSVDIYALGAVLFEMLAGRLPFAAETPHSMMHMHIYERPPALHKLNPTISALQESVIDKALAKDPAQRYESVSALMEAFQKATLKPDPEGRTLATEVAPVAWPPYSPAVLTVTPGMPEPPNLPIDTKRPYDALEHSPTPLPAARTNSKRTTGLPRPLRTNRTKMLQKVHDFWIKGVLDNALYERKAFTLDLEFAAPGAVLRDVDHADYKLPSTANILDIFDDMNRELLILGEPGSGKTILLLQLARDLIHQAQEDENRPIPVVFNLSSWSIRRGPIEAWLVGELETKYQIPKRIATMWVNNGELLPLLDGLDEVLVDYHEQCIQALNRFQLAYNFVDVVICSRIEDYEKLAHRLNLHSSIVLQPLTAQQIEKHIQGPELEGLQTAMKADPLLQQMAQSPFLLNTMAFAYRGMSAAAQTGLTSEADRRNHLFKNYVERKFQLQGTSKAYTLKQVFHWLQALATNMVQQGHTVFYIEGIQANWLAQAAQRRAYFLLVGLVGGLIGGLGTMAIFIFAISYYTSSTVLNSRLSIAAGAVLGIAIGAYFALSARAQEIEVTESLSWSWVKGSVGLLIGISGAIVGSLVYGLSQNTLIGLPFGITLGIAIGMAFGLTGGLTGNEVPMRTRPNQGIWLSAQTAVKLGTLLGLVLALVIGVVFGAGFALAVGPIDINVKLGFAITASVTLGLTSGLCFGLTLALIRGGKSAIEHLVLREILRRNGVMPRNFTQFLDYTATLNLLRKVGGGYIFIHRYLLEYFDEMGREIERS